MIRVAFAVLCVAVGGAGAADPKPVELVLEDQFESRQDLATYRGSVVVLVYGDRRGTDACRDLGEQLHVAFHPSAKGLPPARARQQPVLPLPGVPAGKPSPDVLVTPVACTGKVPGVVKSVLRGQFKKGSPEVPVWLDFEDVMTKHFGLMSGQPNVAVFDARGVLRFVHNGTLDEPTAKRLVETIQAVRVEAAR